ncbi:ribosomal protein S18-alanine N-acetyltransferase [Desulfurivibrio sp. D14AmB]|uniref:ribosomal protein S18-alanine N-acetyltransferase n=1 Tax=Desulfurivibrio sp. D14AmB TaxID=3374370 RepID=UPI00376F0810
MLLSEVTIREMVESDLPTVADLEGEEGAGGWTLAQLAAEFARPGGWRLVALDSSSGQVVSYIIGGQVLDEAEIFRLRVARDHRRRGIAAALLLGLEQLLRRRGVGRCFLEVRAGNQAALTLYAKAGFARRGLRRSYYRDPVDDAVIMQKTLSE